MRNYSRDWQRGEWGSEFSLQAVIFANREVIVGLAERYRLPAAGAISDEI
jgi:hypothetical protein